MVDWIFFAFLKKVILFTFSCAGSLLLRGLFSGCREQGLLSRVLASLVAKHRL